MSHKERIAQRAAEELSPSSIINLGIGIPTLVANYLDKEQYIMHTENGMLGVTSVEEENIDPLIVNAGKQPVGEAVGASYFDSAASFAMIRGSHVDVAILGALQVDSEGLVANWAIPGKNIIGVGGAMDLLVGAKKIIITTNHVAKDGSAKLVQECEYPITSRRRADVIITDLAVFHWRDEGYELTEVMEGSNIEEIKAKTKLSYRVHPSAMQKEG
ncbi:3-oxoacid CoA-transferase subunit B [Salicibibacter cibarius]|uniref:3-oxoacid CoA-transferase subunit B n=1 Tax=Salicibibacter cibarius TaxID=2743000 RepID=A0A7T7CA06_9BACI|nr:3-oxoacid CoA-transferase subunit B [Salicibibacter cibarius]QQK74399.1 3-oxoacid CoA-transferase subunit B [Salicibibacter cibarius]